MANKSNAQKAEIQAQKAIDNAIIAYEKSANADRIKYSAQFTEDLLNSHNRNCMLELDKILTRIGGTETAAGKELQSKWVKTFDVVYHDRLRIIRSKYNKEVSEKSRISDELIQRTKQLQKYEKDETALNKKWTDAQKNAFRVRIDGIKKRIKALDSLTKDIELGSKTIEDATKEQIEGLEKQKDLFDKVDEDTGIKGTSSTDELEKIIDNFLKDQRKEKTRLTMKQRMAKEGGGLTALPKAIGSYGGQAGTWLRKKLSPKMLGGRLEESGSEYIKRAVEKFASETQKRVDSGDITSQEDGDKMVMDYESKLRDYFATSGKKTISKDDLSTLHPTTEKKNEPLKAEQPQLQEKQQPLQDGGTADDVIIKDGKVTKIRKDDVVMAGTDLDGKKDESKKAIIKSEKHLAKLSAIISDMFDYQQEKDEDDSLLRDKLLADSGSKADKSDTLKDKAKELSEKDSNGFMMGMAKKALSAVAPFLVSAAGVAVVGAAAYGAYKLTKGAVEQGMKANSQINDMKEQQYSEMNKRGVNTFDIREKTENLDASELAKVQMANLQAKKVNNLEEELKKENLSKEEKEKLEKQKTEAEEELTKLDKELADISQDALDARKLLTEEEQKAVIGQKALNEQNEAIKSGKFKGGGELSKEDSDAMKSFGGIESLSSTKGDGLFNTKSSKNFNTYLGTLLDGISQYNKYIKSAKEGSPEERAKAITSLKTMAMSISKGKQLLWADSKSDYEDLLNDKMFPEGYKQYLKIEQDRSADPTESTISQYQNMKAFAKGSGKNYAVVGENGAEIIDTDNNQVFSPLGPKEHERGLTSIIKKAFKEYVNEESIFNPSNAKKQSAEEYERTITPLQKTLASKQKESGKNNINTTVVGGSLQQPIEKKIKVPFEVDFVRY